MKSVSARRISGADDIRRATCPFHEDEIDTLYIYSGTGFHCFGCGVNGRATGKPDGTFELVADTGIKLSGEAEDLLASLIPEEEEGDPI